MKPVFRCALRHALTATLALAAMSATPVLAQGAGAAPPPPGVIVTTVKRQPLVEQAVVNGRIEVIDKVELVARVSGFLEKKLFTDGAEVTQGEALFNLEQGSYQAAVAQAQANLASAQANQRLAELTYERTKKLVDTRTASASELDKAEAELDSAKATVAARQADLQLAELNLSYTQITAPMDGRVGRSAVSVGDYVGPETGDLLTLVAVDPVYAVFPARQEILLQVVRDKVTADSVVVKLRLADGSIYDKGGEIAFQEVSANRSTDTVAVRATIPNPDGLLFDNQLVEVLIEPKDPPTGILVPQAALLLDKQGASVYVLKDDDTVEQRRIEIGQQMGADMVVTNGLEDGEQVVTSGLQKIAPGSKVAPQQATGDKTGQ